MSEIIGHKNAFLIKKHLLYKKRRFDLGIY